MATVVIRSTLNDNASIVTPATGSTGIVAKTAFATGLDGKGLRFITSRTCAAFSVDELDPARTRIEFDYKPNYSSATAAEVPVPVLFAIGMPRSLSSIAKLWFDTVAHCLVLNVGDRTVTSTPGARILTLNRWVHVAAEWNIDESDSLKLYVAGVRVDAGCPQLTTVPSFTGANLYVGTCNEYSGDKAEGTIDTLVVTKLDQVIVIPPPPPPPPPPPIVTGSLSIPVTVKEVAGVGASMWPVHAVVPLPYGRFQDTTSLSLVDSSGAVIPAQFEVLSRHWSKDDSIRHVKLLFQTSITAFGASGTGQTTYALNDSNQHSQPPAPVVVSSSGDAISVNNGIIMLSFTPSSGLMTSKGAMRADLTRQDLTVEDLFKRTDVTVKIEEHGPVRSCLRISSPSNSSRLGFAARVYVYAGRTDIKVDLQLQNSDMDVVYGNPKYFKGLDLVLETGVAGVANELRATIPTTNPINATSLGIEASGVRVTIRHFYEKGPNGVASTPTGQVIAQMFPSWISRRFNGQETSGFHWMNDMQCAVKEVVFDLDASRSPGLLNAWCQTVHLHPVVTLPVAWHAGCRVTFDMDGLIPINAKNSSSDTRRPNYSQYRSGDTYGWDNFGAYLYRKSSTSITGDRPESNWNFILSENPSDYFLAEDYAMGELNMRPEWMPGYRYDANFAFLQLTENPYGGTSWRKFEGHGVWDPTAGYLPGAGYDTCPHDDEHGWFYMIEDAYWISGNPWIRDWYEFIGEFRKTRLNQRDPWPDMSSRAVGHSVGHALSAYRVIGDKTLLTLAADYYRNYIRPQMDMATGGYASRDEAPFQLGYMLRTAINAYCELPMHDQDLYDVINGFVRWNLNWCHYAYYTSPGAQGGASSGSSCVICDPEAWLAMHASTDAALRTAIRTHMLDYCDGGMNGGGGPYYPVRDWSQDYNRDGRWSMVFLT